MFHKKAVESLTPQEVFIGSMQYGGHFTDIHEYITTYLEGVMGHPEFEHLTNGHILMMMDLLQRHFDEWFPDLEYAGISQQDWFALTQLFIKEAEHAVSNILLNRKEDAQEGFIVRYDTYDVWVHMPTYYEENPDDQSRDERDYWEDALEVFTDAMQECVRRNGKDAYSPYDWYIVDEGKRYQHIYSNTIQETKKLIMAALGDTRNEFKFVAYHDEVEGRHAIRFRYCVYNASQYSTLYFVPMTNEEIEAESEY